MDEPPVQFYQSADMVRVPYPTWYAYSGVYTQSTYKFPYIHILNRIFIVKYHDSLGELKTLLFSPSDIEADRETPFFKRPLIAKGKHVMGYFTGKTIYITGAASGIGLETAKQLIGQDANLVLFDKQALDKVVATLQGLNKNKASIISYELDVTDADTASKLSPDILMHFVGITGPWTFDEMSQEQFERVLTINLFGTRNVLAAVRPFLSRGDQVMVTASMASFTGSYGYSSYSASKFAIWGMMQSIGFEWKPDGIDITVFAPPPIDTPLTQAEVGVMAQAGVGMKKLAGELKIDDAVKSMLKGVEKRQFLVVPGLMANLIRLQLRFFPVSWVNWIGNKTVAFSLRK